MGKFTSSKKRKTCSPNVNKTVGFRFNVFAKMGCGDFIPTHENKESRRKDANVQHDMIELGSASEKPWREGTSHEDKLPIRKSGYWALEKHQHLTYYGKMFATGMKHKFDNRVYVELFAGPGRCRFPDNKESLGSPLQMIDFEFTKFVFEKNVAAARALERCQSDAKTHPICAVVEPMLESRKRMAKDAGVNRCVTLIAPIFSLRGQRSE